VTEVPTRSAFEAEFARTAAPRAATRNKGFAYLNLIMLAPLPKMNGNVYYGGDISLLSQSFYRKAGGAHWIGF
jgi:hypothetical protein